MKDRYLSPLLLVCLTCFSTSLMAVTVTPNVAWGGIDCYEIETVIGTYYFDPEGGGLAGFVDNDDKDWISFSNLADSRASGEFRGFPNAVHEQGISCFHPLNSATTASTSAIIEQSSQRVIFETVCGDWIAEWRFYETHCNWTIISKPSGGYYWVLYEGTPNGGFNPATNYLYRSDTRERHYLDIEKTGDIIPIHGELHEWIYFGDNGASRGLLLIQHTDDSHGDRYYAMSPMTVFGFGRPSGAVKVLTAVPSTYTITFVETTKWDEIAAAAKALVEGEKAPALASRQAPGR